MIRSETESTEDSSAIRPFYDRNLYLIRVLSAVLKNLSSTQDPRSRFSQGFDVSFRLFQKQIILERSRFARRQFVMKPVTYSDPRAEFRLVFVLATIAQLARAARGNFQRIHTPACLRKIDLPVSIRKSQNKRKRNLSSLSMGSLAAQQPRGAIRGRKLFGQLWWQKTLDLRILTFTSLTTVRHILARRLIFTKLRVMNWGGY